MEELQRIALGYLNPFLNDLQKVFDWDDDTTSAIYNELHGYLTGDVWWLFSAILALPIALWLFVKGLAPNIPSWILDAVNFVLNSVKTIWNWVVSSINYALGVIKTLNDTITVIAKAVIQAVFAAFWSALSWLLWLFSTWRNTLAAFLQSTYNFLAPYLTTFWNLITAPLRASWDFLVWLFNTGRNFLTALIQNPGKVIGDIAKTVVDAALLPLRVYLNFLFWLKDVAGPFLVAFIHDPVKVMLDLMAPGFLKWLADLLAENW